jgi:hypothetical protein
MQPSRFARWGVAAGLVATSVAAGFGAFGDPDAASQLPVLHATPPASPDSDGDGLPDAVEAHLGTSPDRVDSDGDGYWDAEEIARQSDPNKKNATPVSIPSSVGLGVYEKGKNLHPVAVMYIADGDIRSADLKMGLRLGKQLRDMPIGFFSKGATVTQAPSFNSQSKVLVFDMTMPSKHVHRFGDMSVYAKVDYRGSIISADALNLWVSGGVIVESDITGFHSPAPAPSLNTLSPGQGTTGVYHPLGGGSGSPPPPSWKSGSVCAQAMVVVGVVGSVVVQEVVSADCESGWESYCDSSCSATVGKMINMVDPVALVGG